MPTKATEKAKSAPPAAEGKTLIMMLPTVRCQLRCPYCQWHFKGSSSGGTLTMAGGATWEIGPELEPETWLEFMNRFAPYHVEIAGGEPTLYRKLKELIHGMPEGCTWAITTNGLEVPFDWKCSKNCLGYAISFHLPYAMDSGYVKRVLASYTHCLKLGFGPNQKFSMVITPRLLSEAKKWTADFRKWGHVVHVNPAALTDVDWDDYPEARKSMEELAGAGLIDFPWKWEQFPRYKACSAGDKRYFFLLPDGNVLRCHSQVYWKDSQPIGHIRDWQPEEGTRPCGQPHLWVCDDRATEIEK